MTIVRVVLLLVGLLHYRCQGRCLAAAGLVMSEVSRFRSHHLRGKWAASPFLGLH